MHIWPTHHRLAAGHRLLLRISSDDHPEIDIDGEQVHHHGQFSTAYLALALDGLRAALHHAAELSAARLSDLVEPDLTGLPPFLAVGPAASSGTPRPRSPSAPR